jgi:hypothetical protein
MIKKMKASLFSLVFVTLASAALAQTTLTTGTWNDGSVWSGGTVPTAGGTVTVNKALELNTNLTINGTYTFSQNVTDFPGGSAYTLMVNGVLDVTAGTTNFEGVSTSVSSNGSSITVRNGATLILTGPTSFDNGTTVLIEAGGTLIVNGNFDNNIAGSGSFTVQGIVKVNGNYTSNGNVDIVGGGDFITTGSITTTGTSGTVFGSPNDCAGPNCSGQNLCLGGGANVITPDQYLCSGSSASQLTGDNPGTSYQWQSSTTSSSSGFSDIGGATSQNYTPPTPAQTTWYKRKATNGTCTGTSAAVVITIIPGSSWSGATSTDWHTGSNWCGGSVPASSTDVTISAGVPNMPVVGSGTGLCRNLTINNGATVTVNSGLQLSIKGNLTNNGTITVNGTIGLTGTTAQTISGTGLNFYSQLLISNTSGAVPAVTFSNNGVNLTTGLTLTSGAVNLSGFNLTIGTSGTSAGSLSYTAGRIYNGNITRWIGTGSIAMGASQGGHFPIGSSANYRPIYFSNSGLGTAGTIRVNHTAVTGSTAVSFSDAGTPIQTRSNSFWTVAIGNGLAAGTFAVRTEGTGMGTVNSVADLRLTLVGSAAPGTAGANALTVSNPQVNRTGIVAASLANNYYWGSVNSGQTPLPVHLLSFSGKSVSEGIQLKWTTTAEVNFKYFSIERSEDGMEFHEIGNVDSKGGYDLTTEYTYLDGSVHKGRFYYRLKRIDLDGSFEYSSLVSVDSDGIAELVSVYPNPNEGKFKIALYEKTGTLQLIDRFGKLITEASLTEGEQTFTSDILSPGIYYLKVTAENRQQVLKIIVSR